MKFLFGMEPIAHLDSKLTDSFKLMGFEAHKYSYQTKHVFYHLSDYQPLKHDYQKMLIEMNKYKNFDTIDDFLSSDLYDIFEKEIAFYLNHYDVFCFINGRSLLPCNFDFPILTKHNKIIISIFSGSEIRYPPYAKEIWNANHFEFPNEIVPSQYPVDYLSYPVKYLANFNEYVCLLEKKRQHVLMAENYAHLLLSVPEMSGIQTSPYLPYIHTIDTQNIQFKNQKRIKPVVAHLPSNPIFKKTDFILKQVSELKEEGLDFDFIYQTQISHAEVIEVLQNSDILIDQMSLFPATIAHEAMAAGCVCLTGNDIAGIPVPLKINDCPAVNINPSNLKNTLREQILNFQLRNHLIEKGRDYIDQFCKLEVLSHRILELLDRYLNQDFDYFPSYSFKNMIDLEIESNFIKDLQMKSTIKNGIFDQNDISQFLKFNPKDIPNFKIKQWKDDVVTIAPYIHVNAKYQSFFKEKINEKN